MIPHKKWIKLVSGKLVRFWETLMRPHKRKKIPLTMIMALHQEERALDVARATNGQLYILGWQKKQEDSNVGTSVKRVVLLAPGYHPLKPGTMFQQPNSSVDMGGTANT